jgi:alkylation response protein AidB-like acyl-CoA dehydrogenase
VALLEQVGVLGALVPAELGGYEIGAPAGVALIEDLAYLSGPLGWLAFTGMAGGMFSVELPASGARAIWAQTHPLIAYAGASNGVLAEVGDGDFALSGSWHMASGVTHAPWMALGCTVEGGRPAATAVALVPASVCRVGPLWNSIGLPDTGTAPVAVDGATVPGERVSFDVRDNSSDRIRRRYRVLVPSAIAAVSLGIGMACLDATAQRLAQDPTADPSARRANSELVQHELGYHYAQVLAARSLLHDTTAEIWQRAQHGEDYGLELAARQRLAAAHAAHAANYAAEAMSRLAGVSAVTSDTPVAARWMEARTVLANVTVRDLYYRVYGGVAADGTIPRSWP